MKSRVTRPTVDDDARFAIGQFSAWIMNADTKAAVLITANTLLVSVAMSQRGRIVALFPLHGFRDWISTILVSVAASAIVISTWALVLAIRPKVLPNSFSRFSWPSVADKLPRQLAKQDQVSIRDEAWSTACTLAQIAQTKFRALRLAVVWWAVAAAMLVAALFTAP